MDVASRAALLRETAEHHDPYEKSHPPHNWWDWYAAYLHNREQGSTQEQAEAAAGRYMDHLQEPHPNGEDKEVAALADLLPYLLLRQSKVLGQPLVGSCLL